MFLITFWQLFDKFFMASMSIDRWKWKNCEKQSCQVSRWHLQLFLSVFGSDWSIEIKPLNSCQRPIKNFLHVGLVWRTALWATCSFDQTWIEPTQVKITDQGPTRHYSQGRSHHLEEGWCKWREAMFKFSWPSPFWSTFFAAPPPLTLSMTKLPNMRA